MKDNKEFQKYLEIKKELKELASKACGIIQKFEDIYNMNDFNEIMPFGKYQGKKLTEVPENYVTWLYASGSLDKYENYDLKIALNKIYNKEEK